MRLQDIKRKNNQVPNSEYTEDHRTVDQLIHAAEINQRILEDAKKGLSKDRREAKEELREARKSKVSKEQYKLMQQDIKEILNETKVRIQDLKKTIKNEIAGARRQHEANEAKLERLAKRK